MRKKYYWDSDTRKWIERAPRLVSSGPFIQPDLPEYVSPVTMKVIDGRRERREEMARHGLREVEPLERPQGAGERKTEAQASAERQQLAERQGVNLDARTLERLMRDN